MVMFCIDSVPSEKPTQTADASRGTYPTNHAAESSFAVPVLPAEGRSPSWLGRPVPSATTWPSA
ncbi:hypothetical protein OCAE111667_04010 [Occultella aeris]|uniref:Uncharacterized protein n=1 Tax=Occultella aeris TaxID=2761496 RepID=A0A7M4DDT3_9MICO|nr:hypothetical protein HALOF300_00272 [Occultella aeris]